MALLVGKRGETSEELKAESTKHRESSPRGIVGSV
jgi:hypothetical protein